MQVTLKVRRFDPDSDRPVPRYQEYELEMAESNTVLDGLIRIREEFDGTLALRCSCRSAICGSCAMRINGQAGLACNTLLINDIPKDGGPIVVEPAGNLEVEKDLIVDFGPFWSKIRAVQPWLQPDGPEPETEYIAPAEDMQHLTGVMACIMCGACVSDCTVLEVDDSFLGPAALAKAYRFVRDPRDDADTSRLGALDEYGGVWDCTRCMQCVEVCPKGVDPMGRIMALRDRAMDESFTGTTGARHANAFADSVEHSGWLDETKLVVKSHGITNVREMIKLAPVGLRSLRAGKMPPLLHKKISGVENVQRVFDKVQSRKED